MAVVRGELSVSDIQRSAVRIARQDGLGALSMRRVAADIGVWPTALYHHVRGKDGLVQLVLDAALAELDLPPETLHWDAWLREFAVRARTLLLDHPGVAAHLADHGTASRAALELVDVAVRVLRGAGFGDRDAAVLFIDLFGFLTFRVRREEALRAAPDAVAGDLADAPPLDDLAAVLPYWRSLPPEEYLLDGVDLLLDGARVRLERGGRA